MASLGVACAAAHPGVSPPKKMTNPELILERGCKILESVLGPHGFQLQPGDTGVSSGGRFASGFFVRGNRKLELHFRYSLGLVRYHFGAHEVSHDDYLWALLGPSGGNKYPGFGEDPLDGFRDLVYDLEHYGRDFVSGEDETLEKLFQRAKTRPKGLNALGTNDAI